MQAEPRPMDQWRVMCYLNESAVAVLYFDMQHSWVGAICLWSMISYKTESAL